MPHYLLASHDGYGLGHARRSSLLASALLDADPASRVTLVTGLPFSPSWLGARAMEIVRVPPMLKHQDHGYQALGMSFEDFKAAAATQIPVQRVGTPEDIANLASFLVSEGAGFICGQVIYAAGGPKD